MFKHAAEVCQGLTPAQIVAKVPLPAKPVTLPCVQCWRVASFPKAGLQLNYYPGTALRPRELDESKGNKAAKEMQVAMKFEDRAQKSDTLTWTISTDGSAKPLSLGAQRFKLRSLWKQAMFQALKNRGLRSNGRWRDPSDPRNSAGNYTELFGTLEVSVHRGAGWDSPRQELVDRCDQVLYTLTKGGLASMKPTPQPWANILQSPRSGNHDAQNLEPQNHEGDRAQRVARDRHPLKRIKQPKSPRWSLDIFKPPAKKEIFAVNSDLDIESDIDVAKSQISRGKSNPMMTDRVRDIIRQRKEARKKSS